MMVCAHGDVADYCNARDMNICETWDGDLRSYRGICRVLVTDSDISQSEYYFLKGELLARGVELISTRYKDDELLSEYLVYASKRSKESRSGRRPFGDEKVIRRVCELRSAGLSLRGIRDSEGVCHQDGRKLSLSTIAKIIEKESRG